MFKKTTLFKKIVPVVLVLAITLAAFPFAGAAAAGLNAGSAAQSNYPRLEYLWASQQARYKIQSDRLASASNLIARAQALIDAANSKGWDTSGVQAALNALSAVIPAVQAAHDPGAAIIASHAGFDANGNVTDRPTAIATVKSMAQVFKNTRAAMNGTWKALHDAVKAFRQAHPRPATTPSTTSSATATPPTY